MCMRTFCECSRHLVTGYRLVNSADMLGVTVTPKLLLTQSFTLVSQNVVSALGCIFFLSVPVEAPNGFTFEVNGYSIKQMKMQYFLQFLKRSKILASHWLRACNHSSKKCIHFRPLTVLWWWLLSSGVATNLRFVPQLPKNFTQTSQNFDLNSSNRAACPLWCLMEPSKFKRPTK